MTQPTSTIIGRPSIGTPSILHDVSHQDSTTQTCEWTLMPACFLHFFQDFQAAKFSLAHKHTRKVCPAHIPQNSIWRAEFYRVCLSEWPHNSARDQYSVSVAVAQTGGCTQLMQPPAPAPTETGRNCFKYFCCTNCLNGFRLGGWGEGMMAGVTVCW